MIKSIYNTNGVLIAVVGAPDDDCKNLPSAFKEKKYIRLPYGGRIFFASGRYNITDGKSIIALLKSTIIQRSI